MSEDKTELLDSLKERIAVIEKLPWTKIAELGQKYGIEKDAEGTWKDKAEEIAIAEAEERLTDPEPEVEPVEGTAVAETSQVQSGNPESQKSGTGYELVRTNLGVKCSTCGQGVRTGLQGELICPVKQEGCPRN